MNLTDLLHSPNTIVRTHAQIVAERQQELVNKQISREEYDDLIADALDLDRINELTQNLEERKLLQTVFETLVKIAGSIPL